MKNALIGYTGFVGSNLAAQKKFECMYNSKNFREMAGQSFCEVVCSGVSALKQVANRDPEGDRQRIRELEEVLATIQADRFILISTIDVYPSVNGVDEEFDCHALPNHAYGKHRLLFEDACRRLFSNCYVIRLPGLFGNGIKKNVIFDLLNDNFLEAMNPASSFQYYYLQNLHADIQRAVDAGLHLVNLFTEPVATKDILERFFPGKAVGQQAGPEMHYDIHTRHAERWGRSGPYIHSRDEVLSLLGSFIQHYARTRQP